MRVRFLVLMACASLIVPLQGCSNRDLRGWWADSDDGQTYFVLEDTNSENCPPVFIDSKEVVTAIGSKVHISAGNHSITCGKAGEIDQGVEFTVPPGVIYHFDYWGP